MITVVQAQSNSEERWRHYVQRAGSLHHAFSWEWRQIFQSVFGHQPYYLLAQNTSLKTSETVGVLPLFHVRSVLFGEALISVPYLNGGGIAADSEEAFRALHRASVALGDALGVRYVELRHRKKEPWMPDGTSVKNHKVGVLLDLASDSEAMFRAFPAKLRSQIRRPQKSGVRFEIFPANDSALSAFYSVFAENMRDLGTPVYPKALFAESSLGFDEAMRIALVLLGREVIAAGIVVGSGDSLEIPWASSLRRTNHLAGNMLLYWGAIAFACEQGFSTFDFGRSTPDSGTHRFKLQWGGRSEPLHWYYPLHRGALPEVNPSKYGALTKCWQKLPLPLANSLGPWLTRGLP